MKATTSTASGQRNLIKSQLENFGSMSTLYARKQFGIPHPGGRICELRRSGLVIKRVWKIEYTPDGEPHRMANYILGKTKDEEVTT
jgi:hypothetical protein